MYGHLQICFYMQTLETFEKREISLQQKISGEVERAKEFTRAKNKQGSVIMKNY